MTQPPSAPVLVVEDDHAFRSAVCRMLRNAGYDVIDAANGSEALQILHSASAPTPCVVVLDLRMPVMSGWEVLKVLRGDSKLSRVPVIVTSASRPPAPEPTEYAPVVWLRKPIDPEVLLDLVKEHARPPS